MAFQLVTTEDGSLSSVDSETQELCHNRAGAYTEAVENYVKPSGLLEKLQQQGHIRVLDACYGMGYNTWALLNEALRVLAPTNPSTMPVASGWTISVVAIEQSLEVLHFLPRILAGPTFDLLNLKTTSLEHNTYYRTLMCHSDTKGGMGTPLRFTSDVADGWGHLDLTIWVDDLRHRLPILNDSFDAVFHDAFSPQKMPELWTLEIFQAYHRLLQEKEGKVLTYSAAAAVRGALQALGFHLSKTPALGAKSGGTIGQIIHSEACVMDTVSQTSWHQPGLPLEAWEMAYLQSKAGLPYSDPTLKASREVILQHRQQLQQASTRPSGATILKQRRHAVSDCHQEIGITSQASQDRGE